MVVGDFLQVKYFCRLYDQVGINIRHFQVMALGGTLTNINQDLTNALSTTSSVAYKQIIASLAKYFGLSVQILGATGWEAPWTSTFGQGFGTAVSGPLPLQTTGMITLKTGLTGKKNRGRVYVPFPSLGDVDSIDGTPITGYVNRLNILAQLWNDDYDIANSSPAFTATLRPQLYHPAVGNMTTITSAISRKRFATQRRRGNYGRTNPDPF